MPFLLVRGYEQTAPDTGTSVTFDAQSEFGKELAGAVSDRVRWIGGWELNTGMWREFQIDGGQGDSRAPLWLGEITRAGAQPATGPAQPVPYANAGYQMYVALGLLPSVRNPEVIRTWVFTFCRDATGALKPVTRYEVCQGAFDLDEHIDAVYCDDIFCLDFFGDGGLALVLPWHYRQLGYFSQIMTGADVVRISLTGGLTAYDHILLGPNDDYRDFWTVSDLDHDGKWEIQVRVKLMDGGYFGRFLIQPNLWRNDWALKYDPSDPFYKEQADFYRVFLSELLNASANLHQPKYSGENLDDDHYIITIDGTTYNIDKLVEESNIELGRIVSFEQALVYMQSRLLRGARVD